MITCSILRIPSISLIGVRLNWGCIGVQGGGGSRILCRGIHIRLKGDHLQQFAFFQRKILTIKQKTCCWGNSFEKNHMQKGLQVNPLSSTFTWSAPGEGGGKGYLGQVEKNFIPLKAGKKATCLPQLVLRNRNPCIDKYPWICIPNGLW